MKKAPATYCLHGVERPGAPNPSEAFVLRWVGDTVAGEYWHDRNRVAQLRSHFAKCAGALFAQVLLAETLRRAKHLGLSHSVAHARLAAAFEGLEHGRGPIVTGELLP